MNNLGSANGNSSVLVDQVADWLITQALGDQSIEQIFEGCCVRLHAAGIPIARGQLAFNTLHPLFKSISHTWTPGNGIQVTGHEHDAPDSAWDDSPFYYLIDKNIEFLRRKLAGPEKLTDFPLLEELAEKGMTEYMAYIVAYNETGSDDGQGDSGDGIVGSWTSDRDSGFHDGDLRALNRIQRRLAVACKVQKNALVARNVLNAYLGKGAGSQVLKGQIKLGDMIAIHSVIWYSDLRGSTALAENLSGRDFLTALNQYFDSTAGAVIENGGEVLRFVGDAVLAIFPINEKTSESQATAAAISAATIAKQRLTEFNDSDTASHPLKFGLGLHIGDVLFGNIGVPERLEFSVIGPAANEVARLESLTKVLQRDVLVSKEFAEHHEGRWEALGKHAFKGSSEQREVLAPLLR